MAGEDSVAGNMAMATKGGSYGGRRRVSGGRSWPWRSKLGNRIAEGGLSWRQKAGPLDDRKLGFMAAEDENSLRQNAGCHGHRRRAL
jgi:hypothetical protein